MATESELTAYLKVLEAAKYSGVLRVKHGDTETTFRSVAELNGAISDVKKSLAIIAGTKRKPRYATQMTKGD